MTFTKDRLEEIAEDGFLKHGESKELARMALAGMESEPVAWRVHTPSLDLTYVEMSIDAVEKIRNFCEKENAVVEITPLYTAPQPLTTSERAELENYRNAQSDMNYQHLSELYHAQEKRLFKLAQRIKGPAFDKYAHSPSQAIDVLESAAFGENGDACRAAMLQGKAEPAKANKLPMQPLVIDAHGTLRFKENPIVRTLLDYATEHGYGLNEIALEQFDTEDQMQLAQLIGYSLSGYGTLSYVTDESYDRASAAAPQQEVTQALAKGMKRYGDAMQELAKKEVK